jgi:hypothetical protein
MHSGWGVLVAVTGDARSPQLANRRRIVVMDPNVPGGNQPFHYAAGLKSRGSQNCEEYISKCAALSETMALAAIVDAVQELKANRYSVAKAAVLTSGGRPLPSLDRIIASHPLIHTAEGEFFRKAVMKACERFNIAVEGIRERELGQLAKKTYASAAARVQSKIANLGKSVGPPWTSDHKNATLAALVMLDRE